MHFFSIFLSILPLAYANPIPSRCLELQQLDETLTSLADIDQTTMTENGVKKLGELLVAQPAVRRELEKCFTENRRRDLDDALNGLGQSIQGLMGQEAENIDVAIDQTYFIGNYGDYNRQDGGEDQVDSN